MTSFQLKLTAITHVLYIAIKKGCSPRQTGFFLEGFRHCLLNAPLTGCPENLIQPWQAEYALPNILNQVTDDQTTFYCVLAAQEGV